MKDSSVLCFFQINELLSVRLLNIFKAPHKVTSKPQIRINSKTLEMIRVQLTSGCRSSAAGF